MGGRRHEALLKEYSEVSNNFRLLTDIRFKLLAFLPIAAAVAAALRSDTATVAGLVVSLFGLVVTLGLVTYNIRNDQLYDELVGRAATIERSLGLPDGGFAHRPRAWLVVRLLGKKWSFDHRTGIGTIYAASVALWLFGVFASVLELAHQGYVGLGFPNLSKVDFSIWWVTFTVLWLVVPSYFWHIPPVLSMVAPSIWVNFTAFGLTVLLTYWGARSIKRQRKKREDEMRELAQAAVERAIPLELARLQGDSDFLQACEKLSGEEEETIKGRLKFYTFIDPDRLGYYMPRGSDDGLSASHLVALLTDLPPQWIFDCATNRKGRMESSIYPAALASSNPPSQQADGPAARS